MSITLSPGLNCIESLALKKTGGSAHMIFSKASGIFNGADWDYIPDTFSAGTAQENTGTIQIHDYPNDRGKVAHVILSALKAGTTSDSGYANFFTSAPSFSRTSLPGTYSSSDEVNLLADLVKLKISDLAGCDDANAVVLVFNTELDLSTTPLTI